MRCPKCGIEMDEVRKLDVVIDCCNSCGGTWLDEGELDKLRKHVEASRQKSREDDRDNYSRGYDDHSSYDSHKSSKKKRSVFDLIEMFGGEE
ncbi:MAG: zf-TFIIB domain-containing protein [Coriobacteriia bacterium]